MPAPDPIYLNNAATSWPKPEPLIDAVTTFLRAPGGTPGRGGGLDASQTIARVRRKLADLIAAPDDARIVLTSGATDAINLALQGVIARAKDEGRAPVRVVASPLEHNSTVRPLHARETRGEIELVRTKIDEHGRTDIDDLMNKVNDRTELVVVTGAANATGVVQPIAEIGTRLRESGSDALFLVDGAQSVGAIETNVERWGVDLLAIAGHKCLLGPTGVGALYVGPRVYDTQTGVDRIDTLRQGGTGTDARNPGVPLDLPRRFECGTPNTVGFAGLLASLEALEGRRESILAHERALVARMIDALREDRRVRLAHPDAPERTGVLSLSIPGADVHEVATILEQSFGITVRAGLHCAPWAHETLGTEETGMIRVSPGWKTTEDEIDAFLKRATRGAGRTDDRTGRTLTTRGRTWLTSLQRPNRYEGWPAVARAMLAPPSA